MIEPRVFFMNIGWMKAYQGLKNDKINGGGGYVNEHGFGCEIFNFKPFRGRCYGYGCPANNSIALERLGGPQGMSFIDNVLVVWEGPV